MTAHRPPDYSDRRKRNKFPQARKPRNLTQASRLNVLLTGVSSDSHTWNLVFLELVLEEMGHHVTNLGACTPDQDIIDACERLSPDLVVVSSVNGHGALDGERMMKRLRAHPTLRQSTAVIGGQLGIRGLNDQAQLEERLLLAGFDAVFQPSAVRLFQDFVARIPESNHTQEAA